MNLFGDYRTGSSWWHRQGVGMKYLVLLAVTLPALLLRLPWLTVSLLALTVLFLLSTRVPPRLCLRLPVALVVLLVVLVGFQLWMGQPELAVVVPGNLLLALYAARLLLITTRPMDLLDALLRILPERVGLAVGVMFAALPQLALAFTDVRDALRARGQSRQWAAAVTAVAIRAVAMAQATGEALAARGLGESSSKAR